MRRSPRAVTGVAEWDALGASLADGRRAARLSPDDAAELAEQAADDYRRPLKLLAQGLAFIDPLSGQPRRFESRLAL